jgi:hypothetical protein
MLKKRGYISKIRTLQTPAKIQDFLNTIPFNFELDGVDTLKSPLRTLRENNAHCFEGALLAAYLLSLQGYTPLLMYLQSTKKDFDHVIAPFKVNGYWGAISKTNHAVLRYREPVYKTVRELALSYFHEYFLDDGTKTLRYYTEPLDVTVFDDSWIDSEEDLWGIDAELDKMKHFEIVPKKYLKKLRKADQVEREAGKIVEWKKKK